ncbi:MAG TPA: hypothetical protein VIL47_04970 [Candidatus Bipolaricaulota bacterium]
MELKDWALIIGIVAVILAGVVLFGGSIDLSQLQDHKAEVLVERLPQEIEGFELRESHARVDPIFDGEMYSSMVAFEPSAGGAFAGVLARVGAMLYRFKSPDHVEPALAILSLGNTLSSFELGGHRMFKYADAVAGQVTVFWAQGASLVQILAIGAGAAGAVELSAVEGAALQVMKAVIAAQ